MRVMVLMKATPESEAGQMPSEQGLTEMMAFNEELGRAGVLRAGEGLHPSSKGVRVQLAGSERTVVEGPFEAARELVAGFWIWEVATLDEAIEWAKRIPNPDGIEGEVELRPIFEADDFGEEFTPELREQEARLRAETEAKTGQRA